MGMNRQQRGVNRLMVGVDLLFNDKRYVLYIGLYVLPVDLQPGVGRLDE